MATYLEIRVLFGDSDLLERVEVAVLIATNGLADNAANNAWVEAVFSSPCKEAQKVLMGVLAVNNASTVEAIQGSTDAILQSHVNAIVATLISAKAGV